MSDLKENVNMSMLIMSILWNVQQLVFLHQGISRERSLQHIPFQFLKVKRMKGFLKICKNEIKQGKIVKIKKRQHTG